MFLLQGAGIFHPKLFRLSEIALLIGSSSRKTFISVVALISTTGVERGREKQLSQGMSAGCAP